MPRACTAACSSQGMPGSRVTADAPRSGRHSRRTRVRTIVRGRARRARHSAGGGDEMAHIRILGAELQRLGIGVRGFLVAAETGERMPLQSEQAGIHHAGACAPPRRSHRRRRSRAGECSAGRRHCAGSLSAGPRRCPRPALRARLRSSPAVSCAAASASRKAGLAGSAATASREAGHRISGAAQARAAARQAAPWRPGQPDRA